MAWAEELPQLAGEYSAEDATAHSEDGLIPDCHLSNDEDIDDAIADLPKGPVELRREQKEIFKACAFEDARTVTKEEQKARRKNSKDQTKSVAELLEGSEQVTISDPREYQVELFERAQHQNTIAVLDTGSGKTLIAVLLIRHIIDQELEHRAKGLGSRLTFFLVRRDHCPLPVYRLSCHIRFHQSL